MASLIPYSGGQIAPIYSFLPFDEISYSQLVGGELSYDPIDTSLIHTGSAFAVRTNSGNYARMKVTLLA